MAANSEKFNSNQEPSPRRVELETRAIERPEPKHEVSPEKSEKSAERIENARNEVLESAKKTEHGHVSHEHKEKIQQSRIRSVRSERAESYKKTMGQVQSEMNPVGRTFSKLIHSKPVEKSSELVGNTIARPNAILFGAIGGFIFTITIYLVAKNYGYPLSGFESIAGFAIGWAAGLLFDYLRIEITGRR